MSGSPQCDNTTMALYQDKELTKLFTNTEAIVFSGTNSSDYKLTFSTYKVTQETNLFLGRVTRGNRKAYVPLSFHVAAVPEPQAATSSAGAAGATELAAAL